MEGTPKDFCLNYFKSKALATALKRISDSLWVKTESELRLLARPTPLDVALKVQYWTLISLGTGKKFKARHIYGGHCSYIHFYCGVLGNPAKLAWILKPTPEAEFQLKILQAQVFAELREALEQIGTLGRQLRSDEMNSLLKLSKVIWALNDRQ